MSERSPEGFPAFFAEAPRIRVRDPLAEFLGAAQGGVLDYGYADAVRLAGHSCPTVASAWLMTRAALRALWPDALPERGAVRVEMRDPAQEGVTGVIANVIALVTGATVDTGFHGLAGRFDRRRLLAYGADVAGQVRFTRTDNGASVTVAARLDPVAGDPRVMQLMPKCLSGSASPAERALFGEIWQERVRKLLVEHADDPQVIVVA
jgi:formylmethanofuran dehydrogenase subunit E